MHVCLGFTKPAPEDAAESLKVIHRTCSGLSREVKGDARVRSTGQGHSAVMNLVTSEWSP